jgi:CRP-like cAMP-binding protein
MGYNPGMSTAERARETLQKTAIFAELSPSELSFLSERAVVNHFETGQLIFAEGDPAEGLYVVEAGEVKIFKTSPAGREQVLSVEGPGSSVAELPVFDGASYPASAVAMTPATLLYIRKKDIHALCLEHPEVALKVLKAIGARLRHLVNMIEELSFKTVRRRVAAVLARMASAKGRKTGRGLEFPLTQTHEELAAQVGTVRELVSRNLGTLQAMKVLRIEGKNVIVPDLKTLEEEAKE